jgi:hypothetical protein
MGEQQPQQRIAFQSLSSLMRVVNPSLTNNALRPLTGCVRTTGCDSGGLLRQVASQRARSSGVVPKRSAGTTW